MGGASLLSAKKTEFKSSWRIPVCQQKQIKWGKEAALLSETPVRPHQPPLLLKERVLRLDLGDADLNKFSLNDSPMMFV